MSKMHLVGIIGQKTSGKSTVGDMLSEELAFNRVRHSFANPLKRASIALLNGSALEEKSEIETITGLTWRQIFQQFGDGIKITFGADIFIKIMHQKWTEYKSCCSEKNYFIIDDLRFEAEVNWLLRQGGVILHVNRTDKESPFDAHNSETLARNFRSSIYMSQIGFGKVTFIDNPGTPEGLLEILNTKIIPWLEPRSVDWQIRKENTKTQGIEYNKEDLEEHERMTKPLIMKEPGSVVRPLTSDELSGDSLIEEALSKDFHEDNSWVRDIKK